MDVRVGLWRNLSTKELMLLNCGIGEDSWESLGLQGDWTSIFYISWIGRWVLYHWRHLGSPHRSLSSVQFSRSVVSDSLWPHEFQHTRPPCPSPTPRVHSNSHPLSWWCHPAISSSVVPFSSCPQSLPASESFPMSQLFAWGGQSTGVSALASFFTKNTRDFRTDWLHLLAVQGTLKSLLLHHSSKPSILLSSAFFIVQLSHPYMTTGKTIALTRWTFVDKVLSLLFNILSILVVTFKK